MTFPILASLLVRLVVLLPFQLLRLSLATPSRWTPLALSVFLIILIKLIRVSLGTVRHPRRFKIVVIDIQITLKQMLRDFIGIRVNRAKKSGMVNITSSVNSRERSGINTILHELNPLFTINVTMRDIKSKNV